MDRRAGINFWQPSVATETKRKVTRELYDVPLGRLDFARRGQSAGFDHNLCALLWPKDLNLLRKKERGLVDAR